MTLLQQVTSMTLPSIRMLSRSKEPEKIDEYRIAYALN